MAGFYIHIPFCKKVCYYCDFHFVASLKYKQNVIDALKLEITRRSSEWKDFTFDTIYIGGGTPSILSINEIQDIINLVYDNYKIGTNPEVTLEANPDDLSAEYLSLLKKHTPINRLSIGIQSFDNNILMFLNRRHNGQQAIDAVRNANTVGFENITVDLIYGIPGLDNIKLKNDLQTFSSLNIPHLSAYHLSIEPKTVFGVMQKRNKLKPIDENDSTDQYKILTGFMSMAGFEHYEISNFAKDKRYSRHNTSYWSNVPYIGTGPSAHSFNGKTRRWNISNNTLYSNSLTQQLNNFFEEEELTTDEKYNDYILTSLRTMWGANLNKIETAFGKKYSGYCIATFEKPVIKENLITDGQNFRISEKGWFIADYLMSEFFMV